MPEDCTVGGGERREVEGIGGGIRDSIGARPGSNDGGGSCSEIDAVLGEGGDGCNKEGGRVGLDRLVSGRAYGVRGGASFGGAVFGIKGELI